MTQQSLQKFKATMETKYIVKVGHMWFKHFDDTEAVMQVDQDPLSVMFAKEMEYTEAKVIADLLGGTVECYTVFNEKGRFAYQYLPDGSKREFNIDRLMEELYGGDNE